ncbi:MAG: hypothetical protein ACI9EF_001666 [Pseudohongiellaceae bacterium]|jgi:hypothetical protein
MGMLLKWAWYQSDITLILELASFLRVVGWVLSEITGNRRLRREYGGSCGLWRFSGVAGDLSMGLPIRAAGLGFFWQLLTP